MGSEIEPRWWCEVQGDRPSADSFVVNDDRPDGGRIGTLLGEADINIANMAVSRNRPKDRALMVLTLDSPITPDLIERIRAEPGLLDPRAIVLERTNG